MKILQNTHAFSRENVKTNTSYTFRIVTSLRKALNMDLLGIDVVIDSNTGKYGIIDVNAFPSKYF